MKGILVGDKSIDGELIYDSRKIRPQIATDRDPKHMDIIFVKGTAITSSAGNNWAPRETLFEIRHNLGYRPKVLAYYYTMNTGAYAIGKNFYAFGVADDYLTATADDTYFRIVHALDDFLQVGVTSTAPAAGQIRVKYMIFSNPLVAVTVNGSS